MTTITATAPVARKPIYTSLFVQVLVALLLGIVLGMATPDFAVNLIEAKRLDASISADQRARWWASGMSVSASHSIACMADFPAKRCQ